jgi:hypothetical protein
MPLAAIDSKSSKRVTAAFAEPAANTRLAMVLSVFVVVNFFHVYWFFLNSSTPKSEFPASLQCGETFFRYMKINLKDLSVANLYIKKHVATYH